ncbi:hypothetical protein PthstB1num2_14380 [Parageobacillus thermoglucosidasius]|uniref:Uncharacterized protein n=1 Tax=Geobacillus sp. (strain Y4.1MC1) TaxID=581103 RepID=A0A7U4DLE4_GEOS0|nr:hypothetical protein Geoth_2414 [Parageobacillus thermoglucosidasius C56-YS93]GMN99398.1 hypothetical protein PthstB1num2_14380 [Parageobacillus thermoglucosidasius]
MGVETEAYETMINGSKFYQRQIEEVIEKLLI